VLKSDKVIQSVSHTVMKGIVVVSHRLLMK